MSRHLLLKEWTLSWYYDDDEVLIITIIIRMMIIQKVGRSMEKLRALEVELERKHGCRVIIIQVDVIIIITIVIIIIRVVIIQVDAIITITIIRCTMLLYININIATISMLIKCVYCLG